MHASSLDYTTTRHIAGLWSGGSLPASEDHCLEIIDTLFPKSSSHAPAGRGDDCAELAVSNNLALSTDSFMEGVHFRTSYFTPYEAGAKALTGAISDLAAAGAVPLGFSLGLVLPRYTSANALQGMLEGMADVARNQGIFLAGGDISRGNSYGFCVTVWGESIAPEQQFFLRRAQASPDDIIFVVGNPGMARVGFELLEKEGRPALARFPSPCLAHLCPRAKVMEGVALARLALANPGLSLGLMDVSDGLVQDIPRLLQKNKATPLGASLNLTPENIPDAVRLYARESNLNPTSLFLSGGEEYALLGTCSPALWPKVLATLPSAFTLGTVTAKAGLFMGEASVRCKGFDHFGKSSPLAETSQLPRFVHDAGHNIVCCASRAWQRGLLSGFNGNISCRVLLEGIPGYDNTAEGCLVTGTSVAKNSLTLQDLCLLRIQDQSAIAGCPPSSESAMHVAIYRQHPESADCAAIVHIHPPKLLALSLRLAGTPVADWLDLPLVESRLYKNCLALVPEFPAGSPELAKAVAEASATSKAVWMQNHGLVVYGPSLAKALALAEELEQIAAIRLDIV